MKVWFDGMLYEAESGVYIVSGPTRTAAIWNVLLFRFAPRWLFRLLQIWTWPK